MADMLTRLPTLHASQRTDNNEKRDARLLYMMVLASRRTHYRLPGVRRDSFLANVMRKQSSDMAICLFEEAMIFADKSFLSKKGKLSP